MNTDWLKPTCWLKPTATAASIAKDRATFYGTEAEYAGDRANGIDAPVPRGGGVGRIHVRRTAPHTPSPQRGRPSRRRGGHPAGAVGIASAVSVCRPRA